MAEDAPPNVLTTSYGQNENTVSSKLAKSVWHLVRFMQVVDHVLRSAHCATPTCSSVLEELPFYLLLGTAVSLAPKAQGVPISSQLSLPAVLCKFPDILSTIFIHISSLAQPPSALLPGSLKPPQHFPLAASPTSSLDLPINRPPSHPISPHLGRQTRVNSTPLVAHSQIFLLKERMSKSRLRAKPVWSMERVAHRLFSPVLSRS